MREKTLERKLTERRIFPSIDLNRSSTRKEELLLDNSTLQKIWLLRKVLQPLTPVDAMEWLLSKMEGTKTNKEFFDMMKG